MALIITIAIILKSIICFAAEKKPRELRNPELWKIVEPDYFIGHTSSDPNTDQLIHLLESTGQEFIVHATDHLRGKGYFQGKRAFFYLFQGLTLLQNGQLSSRFDPYDLQCQKAKSDIAMDPKGYYRIIASEGRVLDSRPVGQDLINALRDVGFVPPEELFLPQLEIRIHKVEVDGEVPPPPNRLKLSL